MFSEAVDFALDFIAMHDEEAGTSVAEVREFVTLDVMPYLRLAASDTVTDAILRRLLEQHRGTAFRLTRGGKPWGPATATPADLLARLVAGEGEAQVRCCPEPSLRESFLGYSTTVAGDELALRFVTDFLVEGIPSVITTLKDALPKRYHPPFSLARGILRMRQTRFIAKFFYYDPNKKEFNSRLTASFATPITTYRLLQDSQGPAQQNPRTPLASYFLRKRSAVAGGEQRVYLDMQASQKLLHEHLRHSKMLRAREALNFIFSLHGVSVTHLKPLLQRRRLIEDLFAEMDCVVLRAAGLPGSRGGTTRVVVTRERAARMQADYARLSSGLKVKGGSDDDSSDDAGEAKQEEATDSDNALNSFSGDDDGGDGEDREREGDDATTAAAPSRRTIGRKATRRDGAESDEEEGEEEEEEEEDERDTAAGPFKRQRREGINGGKSAAVEEPDSENLLSVVEQAFGPFYFSPFISLRTQLMRESERRPVSVVSSLPPYTALSYRRKLMTSLDFFYSTHKDTVTKGSATGPTNVKCCYFKPRAPPPASSSSPPVAGPASAADTAPGAALPHGLSQYTLDLLLSALRRAPHQTCTLDYLRTLMEGTAALRCVRHLHSVGAVTSSGVTERVRRRRVALVTLAPHEPLTEEEKQEVLAAEASAVSRRRLSTVDPVVGPASFMEGLKRAAGGAEDDDATPGSAGAVGRIARSSEVPAKAMRRISGVVNIANGYCCDEGGRVARVHLELWRQLYALWSRSGGNDGAARVGETFWLNAQEVAANMTISTVCIAFGVVEQEVAVVLQAHSLPWSTPMYAVPGLSVVWQQRSFRHGFLFALQRLQALGLLTCATALTPFIETPLAELEVALAPTGTLPDADVTYVFHSPGATAGTTAYAVLSYWAVQAAVGCPLQRAQLVPLTAAEPDATPLQLLALTRVLRPSHESVLRAFYQCQGYRVVVDAPEGGAGGGADDEEGWAAAAAAALPRRRNVLVGLDGAPPATAAAASAACDGARTAVEGFPVQRRNAYLQHHPLGEASADGSAAEYDALATLQGAANWNRLLRPADLHALALLECAETVAFTRAKAAAAAATAGATEAPAPISLALSPDMTAAPPSQEPLSSAAPAWEDLEALLPAQMREPEPPADELEEVAADALRMVLLSDADRHSSAASAKILLCFPDAVLQRARARLLRLPAFKLLRGSPNTRVRQLHLAPGSAVVRGGRGRVCLGGANAFVAHTWARELPPLSTAPSPLAEPPLPSPLLAVERQSPYAFALLRDRDAALALRVPEMRFEPAALAAEERAVHVRTATAEARAAALSSPEMLRLHPARTLVSHYQDQSLEDTPYDGPPSPTAKATVRRARAAVATLARAGEKEKEEVAKARETLGLAGGHSATPRYPSPFHHVDGALHTYVWRLARREVYLCVQRVPDISGAALRSRCTRTGILGRRSFETVLNHLVAGGMLEARPLLLAAPGTGLAPSPFAPPQPHKEPAAPAVSTVIDYMYRVQVGATTPADWDTL